MLVSLKEKDVIYTFWRTDRVWSLWANPEGLWRFELRGWTSTFLWDRTCQYRQKIKNRGAWVAQLLNRLILDLSSGLDFRVVSSSPTVGFALFLCVCVCLKMKSALRAREEGQMSGGGGLYACSYEKPSSLNSLLLLGRFCDNAHF